MDAGGKARRGKIRPHQDTCAVHRGLDDNVEAARLGVELQRHRDARRIHFEQKVKQLRVESWALKQRAELMEREADDADRLAERKMKEGTFDKDSKSESESTMMVCDGEEEERESERSESYAPTEVYSESEQESWGLMYQQGVAVQLKHFLGHGRLVAGFGQRTDYILVTSSIDNFKLVTLHCPSLLYLCIFRMLHCLIRYIDPVCLSMLRVVSKERRNESLSGP